MNYYGKKHEKIFNNHFKKLDSKVSNAYVASIYLLSSNCELWNRSKSAITNKNIDFNKIIRCGISAYSYSLYKVAQDIYTDSTHINLFDICDRRIITDKAFDLIMTALEIGRNGLERLAVKGKSSSDEMVSEKNDRSEKNV